MSRYEIGAMSSRWAIEAPNLDVAIVTLRIYLRSPIPIVCYNTPMQSRFMMTDNFSEDTFTKFVDEHVAEIRAAYKSMVEA